MVKPWWAWFVQRTALALIEQVTRIGLLVHVLPFSSATGLEPTKESWLSRASGPQGHYLGKNIFAGRSSSEVARATPEPPPSVPRLSEISAATASMLDCAGCPSASGALGGHDRAACACAFCERLDEREVWQRQCHDPAHQ